MLYLCDVLDDEDTFPLLMRDCNYINLQNSVSVHTYVHLDWISGKYRTIPLLFIKNMKMKKMMFEKAKKNSLAELIQCVLHSANRFTRIRNES